MDLIMIPIDKIRPNPFQPRETFNREKIEELASSITESGLIQPIVVRKIGETYQIIAGERRWRAFHFAGLNEIPCVVKDVGNIKAMELSLVENWHRLDLETEKSENFIASLYKKGKKSGRYKSINDMATITGIPRTTLQEIISGHADREKMDTSVHVSYHDIVKTRPLEDDPELRKQVLKLREKGEIKSAELREFSKTIKEASPVVKGALLRGIITVEEAKILEHELEEQHVKEQVIDYVEKERSTDRVSFHVDFIKKVEERKEVEAAKVETATGDIWICPICNKKYRLIHVAPTGSHKFEEIVE